MTIPQIEPSQQATLKSGYQPEGLDNEAALPPHPSNPDTEEWEDVLRELDESPEVDNEWDSQEFHRVLNGFDFRFCYHKWNSIESKVFEDLWSALFRKADVGACRRYWESLPYYLQPYLKSNEERMKYALIRSCVEEFNVCCWRNGVSVGIGLSDYTLTIVFRDEDTIYIEGVNMGCFDDVETAEDYFRR